MGGSASGSGSSGQTVCDPFGGGTRPTEDTRGLKAKLFYFESGGSMYRTVNDYPVHGERHPADLYFSRLNVPTRRFTQGFGSNDGTPLKTADGRTLIEYFGLQLETMVRLKDGQAPGKYQFAIISDDGSLLHAGAGGGMQIINNDGPHPTKMGCANQAIDFDASTRLRLRLDYFQGPRDWIALVLLWRKVSGANGSLNDPDCGRVGENYFYDNATSTPKAAYQNLLSRGWQVVEPENFYLPENTAVNPCTMPN